MQSPAPLNSEPREIPLSVQLSLLSNIPEWIVGWGVSLCFFTLAFFPAVLLHDNSKYGAWFATCTFSIVGTLALCLAIYAWFINRKAVGLLRHGNMTQGKFFGVNPGTKGVNRILVEFSYQIDDKIYIVSTPLSGTSRFTIDTCKDVFYDPMQPEQSVVLYGLPDGVHFDEQAGRFWVHPLRYIPFLVIASIVCCEIVALAVLVIHAI